MQTYFIQVTEATQALEERGGSSLAQQKLENLGNSFAKESRSTARQVKQLSQPLRAAKNEFDSHEILWPFRVRSWLSTREQNPVDESAAKTKLEKNDASVQSVETAIAQQDIEAVKARSL